MIDPVTSLGLAINVVQIVDLGFRIIGKGKELARTGTTVEQEHLKKLAQETSNICSDLQGQAAIPNTSNQHDGAGKCHTRNPGDDQARVDLANHRKAIGELAHRTKDVADELSELLSTLSLGCTRDEEEGPPRRRRMAPGRIIKGVWKSAWKEPDVSRLRRTLADLQGDMILRLTVLQSTTLSSMANSFNAVADGLETAGLEQLAAFEKVLPLVDDELGDTKLQIDNREDSKSFSACLDDLTRRARIAATCRRVIETLQFEEIYSRQEAIPEAHARTFKWIFDDCKTDFVDWASKRSGKFSIKMGDPSERQTAWSYANSVKGPFWITGKPGSGKSTLMRYIVQHPYTTQLLHHWAGDDKLIIASHYFWNPGTSMQKSQEGLLRTLLLHVAQQFPDLTAQLVPAQFRTASFDKSVPWTYHELTATLESIAKSSTSGAKICFFIDGLDEYVGEHADLIDLVSSITEGSQIKLCVSSRPWNVFTRAYLGQTDGQLEVQELTEPDIRAYVEDKLSADKIFRELRCREMEECLDLIESITVKAQGVFLWVFLVVRSLLRGLTNDDDLKILRQRLDDYPDTLHSYFERMFNRIESVYRKQSSRLLVVAYHSEKALPSWAPRCVEQEIESPNYAIPVMIPPSSSDAFSVFGCDCPHKIESKSLNAFPDAVKPWHICLFMHDVKNDCCLRDAKSDRTRVQKEKLRRHLDARSADLLELSKSGIGFVHRTARDFVGHSDLYTKLYSQAGTDFDVGLSLARLELVTIKRRVYLGLFSAQSDNDYLKSCRKLVRPPNIGPYKVLFDDLEEKLNLRRAWLEMI